MADIEQPSAAAPVGAWQKQPGGQQRKRRSPYGEAADLHTGVGEPEDVVSIHGMTPGLLNEDARKIMASLMEELDGLRFELDQSLHRQQYLESLADQHTYLPALNRRALTREIRSYLRFREEQGTSNSGCLMLFYLENFEELHKAYGLDAAEAVLIHMARQIAGAMRSTDIVGSIGGASIVVLMPLATGIGALQKREMLVKALADRPMVREGTTLPLRMLAVVRDFDEGDTAEFALADLDQRLWSPKRS